MTVPVPPDYLQTPFVLAVTAYSRKKDEQAVSEVKELQQELELEQKVAADLLELELVARKQYDFRMNIAVIFRVGLVA